MHRSIEENRAENYLSEELKSWSLVVYGLISRSKKAGERERERECYQRFTYVRD